MIFLSVGKVKKRMIPIRERLRCPRYVIGTMRMAGNILVDFVRDMIALHKPIITDKTFLLYPTVGFTRTRLRGGSFATWGDVQKITFDMGNKVWYRKRLS